jgi:serine/threonine protein kinase
MPVQPAPRSLGPHDPRDVGGYRIRAVLGDGGMGKVYLADGQDGRPVAVKVVRPEFADDPAFRRRFEQEVATASRVRGDHTASVISAGTRAAQPWLATEYVPGPSLQYAVGTHGPLPAGRVLSLVAGVAEALRSIHTAGVVHRDLKPSNVILAPDGPKVIDFGIARAADSTSVTRTGMRPGTPAYMSPEHVRGDEVTPTADVFALGVLANYAATGELAFGGGTDPAVAYRILEREPNLTGCPDPVRSVVLRCLDKDPRRRPTAGEVSQLCRSAAEAAVAAEPPTVRVAPATDPIGDAGWTSPVVSREEPWDPPRRRRPRFVLAGAAVAAIAVAVGVILFANAPDGVRPAGDPAGTPPTTSTRSTESPKATPSVEVTTTEPETTLEPTTTITTEEPEPTTEPPESTTREPSVTVTTVPPTSVG